MRLGRAAAGALWGVCVWGSGAAPLTLSLPGPQERYYVLYIRPSRIHRRKFDPKGNEIEPNFSATRKVNTGFLMSSYSKCPLPFLPQALLYFGLPLSPGVFWLLSMVGLKAHEWPEGTLAQLLPAPHSQSQRPGQPSQLLPSPAGWKNRP